MARCKGCIHDKVCNRDVGHGYSVCPHYTTDVVPKSEVERWRRNLEAVLEERAETKQEIAREILEEIENHLIFNAYGIASISDNTFAELKKKYTEGKKDEDKN